MTWEEYIQSSEMLRFIEEEWQSKMKKIIEDCKITPSRSQIKAIESHLRLGGLESVCKYIKNQKSKAENKAAETKEPTKTKAKNEVTFWSQVLELLSAEENKGWLQEKLNDLMIKASIIKEGNKKENNRIKKECARYLSFQLVPSLCSHCAYLNKLQNPTQENQEE